MKYYFFFIILLIITLLVICIDIKYLLNLKILNLFLKENQINKIEQKLNKTNFNNNVLNNLFTNTNISLILK